MILKASERANATNLARHLMNAHDNEHVELHDLRGFSADDLDGAFQEAQAVSRGTRCKNFLFSLSLSPPEQEDVPIEAFENAISDIEIRLGLESQPRAIVFHEKEGRRHAHAVWSRIDPEEMKAINLPHYKRKLNEIARDLYRQHGWEMPKGFENDRANDPLSYTLAEWQQAKRSKQDPKAVKAQMQDIWKASDSRQAFETALREHGYFLARGDKRGFVAVDWRGEVYSLSGTTGAKLKELKARLGDPSALQSTYQAKQWIAQRLEPKVKAWAKETQARAEKTNLANQFRRDEMVQRHHHARDRIRRMQEGRLLDEARKRAERTPKGMRGVWGWITGKNRKIRLENEAEMQRAQERDRAKKHQIIQRQLAERRNLQRQIKQARDEQGKRLQELNREVAKYMMMGGKAPIEITKVFDREAKRPPRSAERTRAQKQDRDRGPDFTPN